MAEHSIMFKIGSVFTGEGFKKAENTVKTMNAEMKKGMGAAQQMSSFLGQLDTSSSKAATAMTGMLQALMSMNVTVIASQAAIMALNLVTSEMVKKYDELKQKADEVRSSVEKAFNATLSERISAIKSETAQLASEFERITKEANAFQDALNGVQQANQNGGIAHLQLEKLNAMLEAHSEAQRQNIEAAYNLKIAIQKSADTEATWQLKIEQAHQARVDNANRLSVIDKQLASLSEERSQLEQTMMIAKESNDTHWVEIQKQVNALKEQEKQLETQRLTTMAASDVLELKEQQVKQEAINAQTAATTEIRNAELAEQRLSEAKHQRSVNEEAARDAADQKAAADLIDAQEVKSAADIQKELNAASKSLAAAERDFQAKLNEWLSFDIIAEAAKALAMPGKDGMGKSGILPVDVQKTIQMQVADNKVDEAIRNGVVTNVKDADKLQRETMRKTRDEISKNQSQQIKEAQKYQRLKDMNPKALCSSDKEFMAKYEKIQAAAEQRKKDLADAKKAVENQKEDMKKSREALENINNKLDGLGLK